MPGRFDPAELLRTLLDHGCRFVVVGGVAGTLAGSPVATRDLDLVYDRSPDNLDRLIAALTILEARYKDPAGRRVVPDAARLLTIRVSLLTTNRGDLDLLRLIGKDLEYEHLLDRTVDYDLGELRVQAIDLETLIEAKEYADRPKDRYALPFLRELLRLKRESGDDCR
jgi:predicted nucleotidyltransferase